MALSKELAQVHLSDDDDYGRAILCEADPTFVLYRLSERLGLPVVPEWAAWVMGELKRGQKIHPLLGIGCHPVAVYGTKESFLRMISSGLTKKRIVNSLRERVAALGSSFRVHAGWRGIRRRVRIVIPWRSQKILLIVWSVLLDRPNCCSRLRILRAS